MERFIRETLRHGLAAPLLAVSGLLALLAIGDTMLFTAAAKQDAVLYGDRLYSVRVHLLQTLLALAALPLVATLPMGWLRRRASSILGLGVAAALLPLFPQFGVLSGGANREVALGPFRWEPGLVLAMAVVLWTASVFARRPLGLRRRVMSIGVVAAALLLAMLQPDFSLLPLVVAPVGMQAWRAGLEGRRAFLLGLAVMAVVTVGAALHPYVERRVEAWLHPQQTARFVGRDYLLLQQGTATGGVTGSGYGKGKFIVQTGAAKNDYFFAHVVEELGYFRAGMILFLYLPILFLGIRVAEDSRDRFVALLGTGMSVFILTAATIHTAVSLRFVPVTAIHMPFMSFGGTPLVAAIAAFGLLIGAYRSRELDSSVGPEEETKPSALL